MKFSIGDKIILNRTGDEGHISAIINQTMMEVSVNGTTFPVHIEDIDHPYLKWFTDKNKKRKTSIPEQLPVEKIKERQQRLAKGVYLSFMPVFKTQDMEDVADVVKIYLLNELPQAVKFSYDVRFAQKSEFRHEGVLHGFGNVYLHSISYMSMNEQPRFHWQLADATNTELDKADGVLRIRPSRLFEHINDIQVNGGATFSYSLINDFETRKNATVENQYNSTPKSPQQRHVTTKNIEPPKHELDLHIEQLVDTTRGMSNGDIVQLQLDTLKHYLQLAIVNRQERMVVIHGLGKGKLREEVHAILKKTPEVARFRNEWSAKYGFGATEILFRY